MAPLPSGLGALALGFCLVSLATAIVLLRRLSAEDRRRAERENEPASSKQLALEALPAPYLLTRSDGTIVEANQAGHAWLDALGIEHSDAAPGALPDSIRSDLDEWEYSARLPDGSERHYAFQAFAIPGIDAPARGLVARDMTVERSKEQELIDQAHYDGLTGLPNRRLFHKQLNVCLAKARLSGTALALILLDLDRFKDTNDTLGHDAGDTLLRTVSETLQQTIRRTDLLGRGEAVAADGLARLGGDEFAIVLPAISQPEDAPFVAERVLRALNTPVAIHGANVLPTASIGVAIFPGDGEDAEALSRAADQALYRAKELGRNQYQVYHSALNRLAERRRTLRGDLKHALAEGDLRIFYQPVVDLASGRVVSAEALLRWNHPELGQVGPGEFVPIAETSGLAPVLGGFVLEAVCSTASQVSFDGSFAVNVSPGELSQPDYFERFATTLQRHGVDPSRIEIEVTERALLDESVTAATNIRDLRAIGIGIQLDDFGTGQSALVDLLKHRIDGIKLDRTFTVDVLTHKPSAGVVRALIELADELDLGVVAEGVEEGEQAHFLHQLGCARAQGYHWAAPMPLEEFVAWLEGNGGAVAGALETREAAA